MLTTLTERQVSNLTSAGDCFEHYHSSDRVLSHGDVAELQNLAAVRTITGDFTVGANDDFLLVDTSVVNIAVTLPLAGNGRELEIMKNADANYISIKAVGTDLILGANELRVYNYGTSIRLKAIPNGWAII